MFQDWHKEFDKFWPEHSKISKVFTLMGSFWAKYILFELKKYRGVIFHETEVGYKIWRGINLCCFKIDIRNLTNSDLSSQNSQDFHFNGLLLNKIYIVWAKKVQRSYLSWHWRLLLGKWHERNLANFHQSTWKC